MISSDSQPIQFWDVDDETFNEKDVCGMSRQDCFCQIFQTDDTITVQFKEEVGDKSFLILRVFDSDENFVGGIQFENYTGYKEISFTPSDLGMESGQSYYFQIEDSATLEAETGEFTLTGYDATLTADVLAASATPTSGAGTGSSNVAVNVTSEVFTCTVFGGTSPYVYLWQYVSGDASILPDTSTASTTTFTASCDCGAVPKIAVYRCRVTDNVGTIAYSNNVTVTLTNTETTCL